MPIMTYSSPEGDILVEMKTVMPVLPEGAVRKGAGGAIDAALDGGSFEAAIARLKVIANAVARTMAEIATTPETAEVELALKFAGKAGIILAESSAEAQLKVKLVWKPQAEKKP